MSASQLKMHAQVCVRVCVCVRLTQTFGHITDTERLKGEDLLDGIITNLAQPWNL